MAIRSETLAQFLKRKRYEFGYTQAVFAKKIGITETYYGWLEQEPKGNHRFRSAKLIKKLADATGATTEFIRMLPRTKENKNEDN